MAELIHNVLLGHSTELGGQNNIMFHRVTMWCAQRLCNPGQFGVPTAPPQTLHCDLGSEESRQSTRYISCTGATRRLGRGFRKALPLLSLRTFTKETFSQRDIVRYYSVPLNSVSNVVIMHSHQDRACRVLQMHQVHTQPHATAPHVVHTQAVYCSHLTWWMVLAGSVGKLAKSWM